MMFRHIDIYYPSYVVYDNDNLFDTIHASFLWKATHPDTIAMDDWVLKTNHSNMIVMYDPVSKKPNHLPIKPE